MANVISSFFAQWDAFELRHPWGVTVLSPLLSEFGVAPAIREEVDSRLFLDLVSQIHPSIRRIRVESRHASSQFWLHVVLCYPFVIVSFQRNPNARMERSVAVTATPCSLMACILAFHRWSLGLRRSACGRGMLLVGERRCRI
jgi:hypothetical protein